MDQVPRFMASPESTDEICAAFQQLQAAKPDVLDMNVIEGVAGTGNQGSSSSTLVPKQSPSEMGQREETLEQPLDGAASISQQSQAERRGITHCLSHLASGLVDDCPPEARSSAWFLHDIDMTVGPDQEFQLDNVALDRDVVVPWTDEARGAAQHELRLAIAMLSHHASPDQDLNAAFDIGMPESGTLAAQGLQPFDVSGELFGDNRDAGQAGIAVRIRV